VSPSRTLRPHRWVIQVVSAFIPKRLRTEWRREWDAELTYQEAEIARWHAPGWRTWLLLMRRSLGSAWDAVCLQRRRFDLVFVQDFARACTSDLALDLRYGLRRIARAPGFAAVVLLTMSVGIGASTAVFSVVRAVLLKPLPYPEADRLVRVVETVPPEETPRGVAEERVVMEAQRLIEWRASTKTLSEMGGYVTAFVTVSRPEGASRAVLARVSPTLFPMLGARMQLGRSLFGGEAFADSRAVVLSADAWYTYFGGSPEVIGETVALDGAAYTVVGVVAKGFDFPSPQTQFWIPLVLAPTGSREQFVSVVARLHPVASVQEASAEAEIIGHQLANEATAQDPAPTQGRHYRVERLQSQMTAAIAPALRLFMAAALLVMLIVTTNVLTLLLARGTRQRQDAVIQRALGASRGRIIRQVMIEAVLLGSAGAAIGLALAYGSVRVLKVMARVNVPELFQLAAQQQFGSASVFPRIHDIGIDASALAFAVVIAVLASVVAGLGPAVQIAADERRSFADGSLGRPGAMSEEGARVRNALVVGQVALATTLLVSAVLLIRSFVQMSQMPMGYDPTNVLTFQLVVPSGYSVNRKEALAHELETRLSALSGVEAAGFASLPPLAGGAFTYGIFQPPGKTVAEMMRDPAAPQARAVSRGYLRAMGVRLLEGRWFDEADDRQYAQALIVTRTLAQRYFGTQSPIGVHVHLAPGPRSWTIVGVVDDIHNGMPWEEPYAQFFMDSRQALVALPDVPEPMRETAALGFLSYAVRVQGSIGILPQLRSIVRQLDPAAALDGAMPLREVVSAGMSRPRFYAVWSGLLAMVAAILGLTGVYATVAYATLRRTREIGIRIALGAQRSTVLRLVLSHGVAVATLGVTLGLGWALLLSRYLTGMLFGVTAANPTTYGIVGALFFCVAVGGSFLPALRATRIDPVRAIRQE
jgi:putative ABC transport system permease protein